MSVATEPGTDPDGSPPGGDRQAASSHPTDPSGRQRWRGLRWPLLLGVALVLVAVVSVVAQGRSTAGYLDPRGTNDQGSRALAELLADRGVRVERVTTARGAVRATSPGELLVVTRADVLPRKQLDMLATLPAERLLIAPDGKVLRTFAPGVNPAGNARHKVRGAGPGCGLEAARLAGNATAGGTVYEIGDDTRLLAGCYPASGMPTLVQVTARGRTTTVVGSARPFMNTNLGDHGNAALAMNLAGSAESVVWLVPDPLTVSTQQDRQASPWALMPDVVPLAVLQLGLVVALVALWRVRRLGRIVPERLPVTVRAAETVEGRARLYKSRRARDRAAAALREGCLARLAPRLGLSPDAEPAAMVQAVTAHTGWADNAVGALLYGSAPADDAALIRLTQDLDALETEVRRQ